MDRTRHRDRLASLLAVLALLVTAAPLATAQDPAVPEPVITGPVFAGPPEGPQMGNYPFFATEIDLPALGYVEEEYFLEGTARSFAEDGTPDGEAAYKTRIMVRRPVDPADFNGVVMLEWVNVTGQNDLEIEWFNSHEYFTREGIAWVGVSAQAVGVRYLPRFNVQRYATMSHPGDDYSFDIFSQAAKVVREPTVIDPLGGIGEPEMVIATGHSQSSSRLHDYHDMLHEAHGLVDAYFMHGSGAAPDLGVGAKVMTLWSETEVSETVPEDADNYVHWETAGSSHVSFKLSREYEPLYNRDRGYVTPKACAEPPHSLVPDNYVMNAAYDHMVEWVRGGDAPPAAPRIERDGGSPAVDEHGNAIGGIRLPHHEVPTAQNDGSNVGAVFCILYGSHETWTPDVLLERYPTRTDYVCQARRATEEAIAQGWLLPEDAAEYLGTAEGVNLGWTGEALNAPDCEPADLGPAGPVETAAAPCLNPPEGDEVRRLEGDGAVGLSIAVSAACFQTADVAVLARRDDHADALAAGALAAAVDGPVLLNPTDALDTGVAAELLRLGTTEVVVAGGELALSGDVADELRDRGIEVTRLAGDTRFGTAAAIAGELRTRGGEIDGAVVALGTRPDGGDAWPDAVSAGLLGAATGQPVVLATPDAVPSVTMDVLDGLLTAGAPLTLAGGTAALSDSVAGQLTDAGYEVGRAAGATRYGTSAEIVGRAVDAGAGLQPMLLASGADFVGALVAVPAAAHLGGAMLLVSPEGLDSSTAAWDLLADRPEEIDLALLVGGSDVLGADLEAEVLTAISDG